MKGRKEIKGQFELTSGVLDASVDSPGNALVLNRANNPPAGKALRVS